MGSQTSCDIDNDGDLDIIVLPDYGRVSVYKYDGGVGTFSLFFTINVLYVRQVQTVVCADMNVDGLLDVVIADNYWGSVTWFPNLGGGNLGYAQSIFVSPVGTVLRVLSLSVVDVDNDGFDDVLFATEQDGRLYWLHDGEASIYCQFDDILQAFQVRLQGGPLQLPSVAASAYYPDSDGDHFGITGSVATTCPRTRSVATVSGDCDDSHATAYPGNMEVQYTGINEDCVKSTFDAPAVLCKFDAQANNGLGGYYELLVDASFTAAVLPDRFASAYYTDKDGDNFGNMNSSAHRCPSGLTGFATNNLDCNDGNASVIRCGCVTQFADVNNDGFSDNDLFDCLESTPPTHMIALKERNVLATKAAFNKASAVISADVDGDGKFDVIASYDSIVVWHRQTGVNSNDNDEPVFGILTIISSSCNNARVVGTAELDGKSSHELIVQCANPTRIVYFRGLGPYGFNSTEKSISSLLDGASYYLNPVVGDMDSDLDLDVVVPVHQSSVVYLFRNDGAGSFVQSTLAFDVKTRHVELGDVDGDSDLDVVFVGNAWLRNDGGVFVAQPLSGVPLGVSLPYSSAQGSEAFCDLDGDRDLDIVVAINMSTVRVYKNNGRGTFTFFSESSMSSLFREIGALRCVDVDGDGDQDVLVTESFWFLALSLLRLSV